MKKLITVFTLFTIFNLNSCMAQTEVTAEKNNYVVLTRKVPQLKPILLAAEALKKEDEANFGEFQVVVCGKTVRDLTDAEAMDDFIDKASNLGVNLNACGFSLEKFKVDPEKLPEDMQVVENGILYNLQLQKKGFISLEL